jgi:hypothetical protein
MPSRQATPQYISKPGMLLLSFRSVCSPLFNILYSPVVLFPASDTTSDTVFGPTLFPISSLEFKGWVLLGSSTICFVGLYPLLAEEPSTGALFTTFIETLLEAVVKLVASEGVKSTRKV